MTEMGKEYLQCTTCTGGLNMIVTVFNEVDARRIDTFALHSARREAEIAYAAGFRILVKNDLDLFLCKVMPENVDPSQVFNCEDSLSSLLCMIEFMRDFNEDL